jgi:NADH-quinone oxidoreductase subunit M
MVLVAAYMLILYRRLFYGKLIYGDVAAMKDLDAREIATFLPLLVLVMWIGIYPATFRDVYSPTLTKILTDYQTQVEHHE